MIAPTYVHVGFRMPIKDYNPEMKTNLSKMDMQILYCKEHDVPYFMPVGNSCYYCVCKKDIWAGFSAQDCQTKLLSWCPYCNHEFN